MPPRRSGFTSLTQFEKYELCKLREKHPTMALNDFARLDECPRRLDGRCLDRSGLSDYLRGWEQLNQGPPSGPDAHKRKFRSAQHTYPFLEHFLSLWIDAADFMHAPVTDDTIRAQAKIIRGYLADVSVSEDYKDFETSRSWLASFKERYDIGHLKRHGDLGQVNEASLPIYRREISQKLSAFEPCNRYSCDESDLMFNKQPETSNVRKGGNILGGTTGYKMPISTFHVANSDGTDKRKIWVIARAKEPHYFIHAGVNIRNLPVVYRYNNKAWMLTGLWFEFLRSLNAEMQVAHRRIALITDNCPTHPDPNHLPEDYTGPPPPELTHITLIYLPPNATSQLQPFNQGIIKSFKAAYRRRYAEDMAEHFTLYGAVPKKIGVLQAIHLIADAWDVIPDVIITGCWKKANICGTTENFETAENATIHSTNQTPDDQLQNFIAVQRTHCEFAMRQIYGPSDLQIQDPNFGVAFDDFFTFDEDQVNPEAGAELPDAIKIVQMGIEDGVLLHGAARLDEESEDDISESEKTLPTLDEAIYYTTQLARYENYGTAYSQRKKNICSKNDYSNYKPTYGSYTASADSKYETNGDLGTPHQVAPPKCGRIPKNKLQ